MVVGLPSDDLTFPAIMMREIKIRSVATGTREDQRAVLGLAAAAQLFTSEEILFQAGLAALVAGALVLATQPWRASAPGLARAAGGLGGQV